MVADTMAGTALHPATVNEHHELCQFLYREAALLDQGHYEQWLELLTPDVRYRVTARTVRPADQEPADYLLIDNFAEELRIRITQISSARLTYSENPPSITRRFVANIQAEIDDQGTLAVTSNLLLHRSQGVNGEQHAYSAVRRDQLRRHEGRYLLASRDVKLDSSVIASMNVSVIF